MKQSLETKADQLLTDVSGIIKRFEEQWRKTGEKYNIFKVAGIEHRETIMCRVLADLMDPHGRHCKGSRYLRLFWKTLAPKLPDKLQLDFERTKVTVECGTDKGRRIDIVLFDGKIRVPIEVKIGAGDQSKQVHDYFKFAKKQNKDVHVPLIYLTIGGHKPSDISKGNLGKDDYVTISFKDEILAWLEVCERENKESKEKTAVPVQENLKQLIAAIKSLCGKSEDEKMKDEILKQVIKNDDTARAALAIRDAMDPYFDGIALNEFTERILLMVKKEFPSAKDDSTGRKDYDWNFIRVPVKGGNYDLEVDYTWKGFCVEACVGKKKRDLQLEERMVKEMEKLTKHKNDDAVPGVIFYWQGGCYPGLENVADDLYFYRLCKVYIEHPQEVAKKIIDMANALEKA
jgi:hypothetical protein